MLAAVIGALGMVPPIPVPGSPVPITAQTLGVMLAGGLLGARLGALSLLVFIGLIMSGLPVLSGMRGGIDELVGPSAGYILSWPIAAFVIGYFVEKSWKSLKVWKVVLFNIIGGIIIVYAAGIPVMAFVLDLSIGQTAISALAFIPGDLIKAGTAAFIVVAMKRSNPVLTKKKTEKKLAA
ncbi:biotin transporter BioY [Pseudalkalibacillus decolorationis]|uniref:biotin transporter BioY n=1 Tax=Pseudalkalibacillus decolorationis TaxID=163879 RepID=UPI0027E27B1C|nr:biotin transporter BioY [Pseudalkalibacillus decolorationis]